MSNDLFEAGNILRSLRHKKDRAVYVMVCEAMALQPDVGTFDAVVLINAARPEHVGTIVLAIQKSLPSSEPAWELSSLGEVVHAK